MYGDACLLCSAATSNSVLMESSVFAKQVVPVEGTSFYGDNSWKVFVRHFPALLHAVCAILAIRTCNVMFTNELCHANT